MDSFCHEPLENPAKWIRLLKRRATANGDRQLHFDILSWPIEGAPAYNAVSYTWGSPLRNTNITVNGRPLAIRYNCLEALEQVLNYDEKGYVWIDSICINQIDNEEKSHQVQMMYAIYKRASQVLACVGEHADDSEWLFRVCDNIAPTKWQYEVLLDELSEMQIDLRGELERARIRSAVVAFGKRGYWNRLWIFQELVAGGPTVLILCGTDTLAWSAIDRLIAAMYDLTHDSDMLDTPLDTLLIVQHKLTGRSPGKGSTLSLGSLLSSLGHSRCSDPRDRLYGLLSLIDWENMAYGMEPIHVDYSRTAWSLAKPLVGALSANHCPLVMEMLCIDGKTPELQNLLIERALSDVTTTTTPQKQEFRFGTVLVVRVQVDHQGVLHVAHAAASEQYCHDVKFMEAVKLMESAEESDHNVCMAQPVVSEHGTVALVCAQTMPGDLLLLFPWHIRESFVRERCLVLRAVDGTQYDVIGTGYLHQSMVNEKTRPDHMVGNYGTLGEMPASSVFIADLRLSALPEDMMMLFHRDCLAQSIRSTACTELHRLARRPLHNPQCAAKVVPSGSSA